MSKTRTPIRASLAAREASGVVLAYVPRVSPQVSEFLHVSNTTKEDVQELAELGKCVDQKRTRAFLTDEEAKRKKYSIETGYDEKTHAYRAYPLEPWTGPKGSQKLYREVVFTEAVRISDYAAHDLPSVNWLREEGLAGVDDDGFVRPLSDSRPAERRAYPGAPGGDKRAKLGKTLREHGRVLVLAAMANLQRHQPVSKISRRKLALSDRKNGMSLSAYDITTEANALKAKRRDLDEYRYLSVSTVRSIISSKDPARPGLLQDGVLVEVEPPKALRVNRTWRTLPRIFAPLADALVRVLIPDPGLEVAA